MNGLRSLEKKTGTYAGISHLFSAVVLIIALSGTLSAQDLQVKSKFICIDVEKVKGFITILPLDGQDFGRIGLDQQLSFQYKSFFTCQIGTTYFTNNDIITLPANGRLLSDGTTTIIQTPNHFCDTIRTIWKNKNGVDIIQDCYPIDFTKSGQAVYKWRFINNNGSPISVGCQYLEDVQISDPHSAKGNVSNDGPLILTRWLYKPYWEQFPNNTFPTLPWFFIGFLFNLPNSPSFDPGLSAMGYLDYGEPLNLIKPTRITTGDWYTLTQTIFGAGPWPVNGSTAIGSDAAVLTEFPAKSIAAGKTAEIGRTSYGTGEYERCIGNLFSIVFYPHHLVWKKDTTNPPGNYTPNPFHIEKFVVDPDQVNSAPNTKITLRVTDPLTIVDQVCSKPFGKSHAKPDTVANGQLIGPGEVAYFDWWACASPAYFCTGAVIDTFFFTANDPLGSPSFVDLQGDNECEMTITIDCAETDMDPPLYDITNDSTLWKYNKRFVDVHDDRNTDRGLKSITWVNECNSADSSNFTISVSPPINPCYNDKAHHIVTIQQNDSTIGCCFEFTFEDCLGHQSFSHICMPGHPKVLNPDVLPPVYTLISSSGSFDNSLCNTRVDSFQVTDSRQYDKGLCSLDTIPGSVSNFDWVKPQFASGDPLVRFSFKVHDSMKDGNICFRATDCSQKANYTDTCFHYCTIPDTIAPRIFIVKSTQKAGVWFVTVQDSDAWDRHIDQIFIVGAINLITTTPPPSSGSKAVTFEVDADTLKVSSFCIEATDLAGNRSASNIACGYQGVGKDSLCPNIIINPALTTNPNSITVDVNDIHYLDPPNNTIRYVWDTGVDSVWFDPNHGMLVPPPISGQGAMTIPQFKISVKDTNDIDTIPACVTINAKDGKGNICSETYCYPYTQDNLPPVIKLWYNPLDKSQIFGVITDSTTYDRGLENISLFHAIPGIDTNFKMNPISLLGAKIDSINATNPITRDPKRSSIGHIRALDNWGYNIPSTAPQHTASLDFYIWVQDFKLKSASQPNQGSVFTLPVYFVMNDTIEVRRKGITDFTFGFTISGDINSIVFDSASMYPNTEMQVANWNPPQWKSDPTGTHITVTGSMGPKGTVLDSKPLRTLPLISDPADSLVILYFHSKEDQSTRHVTITTDSMQFNGGRDTLYTGTRSGAFTSTALMPAPQGTISGGNVVITGACATKISNSALPSAVSLDPPHPNPFSRTTTFEYTVAQDGPVKFSVYDELGQEIRTIVNDFQKQGRYTVTFDGASLGSGNYVARLEAGGVICSRRLGVEK